MAEQNYGVELTGQDYRDAIRRDAEQMSGARTEIVTSRAPQGVAKRKNDTPKPALNCMVSQGVAKSIGPEGLEQTKGIEVSDRDSQSGAESGADSAISSHAALLQAITAHRRQTGRRPLDPKQISRIVLAIEQPK